MTFKQFWRLYLLAHGQPGTRAMHYVAMAFGILAGIEALMVGQPWILLAGIALGYAIATIAHWFVEHNNPLIRISPVWGAVAALRMSWLALTGSLSEELAKHGIVDPRDVGANEGPADPATRRTWMEREVTRLELPQAERTITALDEFDHTARHALHYYGGKPFRYVLLIASTVGLVAGVADLHDLVEHANKPTYPFIQLGAPIIAFAIAMASSYGALVVAGRHLRIVLDRFASLKAEPSVSATEAATIHFRLRVERLFASEMSLRRASVALLTLGLATFAAAEYAEHGLWWAV